MERIKALLIEDDINLGTVLTEYLKLKGIDIIHAIDGEDGLKKFRGASFDIIILDIMMPRLDGFSAAKIIKEENKTIPIIFLSAKTLQEDRIEGFKIGADDYLTKPFSSEELLLRIKAILRRAQQSNENTHTHNGVFNIGRYHYDYNKRILSFGKSKQKLTSKEAELLFLLCINMNNLLNRSEALKQIWGDDNYFASRSMDVFISRVRKFFKDDKNISVRRVRGVGLEFQVNEESE